MPEAGFEPTITASERAKTVHALVHTATVTDLKIFLPAVTQYIFLALYSKRQGVSVL
jgi:hypothetical protein